MIIGLIITNNMKSDIKLVSQIFDEDKENSMFIQGDDQN